MTALACPKYQIGDCGSMGRSPDMCEGQHMHTPCAQGCRGRGEGGGQVRGKGGGQAGTENKLRCLQQSMHITLCHRDIGTILAHVAIAVHCKLFSSEKTTRKLCQVKHASQDE